MVTIGGLLPLLGPVVDPHLVFVRFVTPASSYTWLGKVHYFECVFLVFLPSLHSEVEPLLVASCVRVDLHEQIVCVRLGK